MAKTYAQALKETNDLFIKDRYFGHKRVTQYGIEAEKMLPSGFLDWLLLLFKFREFQSARKLKSMLSNLEGYRSQHNKAFVENELVKRAEFFSDVEGYPLDEQQQRAIVTDEDNNLIIAGAGSGKTTTIVGKIRYLVSCLNEEPDKILPISFTSKSAKSMKERINVRGVTPQTFHKFGLTVLQSVENARPNIFTGEGKEQADLFRRFLEDLEKDEEYLKDLTTFFTSYSKIQYSEFNFETLGEYIQYLKDQNFNTYKMIKTVYKGRETYFNEITKSVQECIIANFLIFNRVDYEYEKKYDLPVPAFGRTKTYRPDFTLIQGDKTVYLEHFGIDRDGKVPPFFAKPNESYDAARRKYLSQIEWKRDLHKRNNTTLVETYSYQFSEGSLEKDLKSTLIKAGINLDPMTPEEIWEVVKKSGKDEVDGFLQLCQTFLVLLKSNQLTLDDIKPKIEQEQDDFLKTRAQIFIDLFEPLFEKYEAYLNENGMIDFSDMINRATDYISDKRYLCPLNYIVIDEFQDLSIGRYRMLEALRSQNDDVKMYCVGDDWQSIYRFAGSDITLFRDFEKFFGFTVKSKIETTYRFNNPLIEVSSEFILKNPSQTEKFLKPLDGADPTEYSFIDSLGAYGDDSEAIAKALQVFLEAGMKSKHSVYLISRYGFDINRIDKRDKRFTVNLTTGHVTFTFADGQHKGKKISMEFVTAHRSKGLEADYTILLNCNSGKYGFPSGKSDDPILSLLLSEADQFENGEERRLFYVALTRTKKHIALVSEPSRRSKFIKELQSELDTESSESKCPQCLDGDIVQQWMEVKGRKFLTYRCSNSLYGCTYKTQSAPRLEDHEKQVEYKQAEKPTKLEPSKWTSTTLSRSDMNKIEAFISKPAAYAFSEKGISKVEYLEDLRIHMSDEVLDKYVKAYDKWESACKARQKG